MAFLVASNAAMADGYPNETLMSHFSEAYVRAIASAAGFAIQPLHVDFDSIDLEVIARGLVEYNGKTGKRRSPHLNIQLKCTFYHQPDASGAELSYDLKIKNYDDLRLPQAMPAILAVVTVPKDWKDRLVWSPQELRMMRCAYWKSLLGEKPTTNSSTIRVKLNQQLSPEELRRIMYLVAQEELL